MMISDAEKAEFSVVPLDDSPGERRKFLPQPRTEDIRLHQVCGALSDVIRLEIVRRLLVAGELSCKDFDIVAPKSTLSHHFRTLRENGVTSTRVDGVQHYISVRRVDLDKSFPGLLAAVLSAKEPL